MAFFTKTRKIGGWLAMDFPSDGLCVAHVVRSHTSKPVVEMLAFQAGEQASRAEMLQKAAKEWRLDRYECTTLLAANEYQLLSVDAPNVPPDEMKVAIRWRLKDLLDFHIDDATIDVLDIPVDRNSGTRNHAMYAVAARNQVIQQRQAMFESARVPLRVIDIPEMAQRNLSVLLQSEGRGLAMLSFDSGGGLLTVTYEGELYLSRRIDVPVAQLEQDDIERRTTCYDRITLELQRSLDHFDRQYHFITVSGLFLAPLSEAAAGLRDYLSTNLYLPVEQVDLSTILDIGKVPQLAQSESQQRYFMSIGAALRHEETVL